MSTADICREIESHFCCIAGTTYTFEVHSAAILPGDAGQAVLQIGASRRSALEPPVLAASMRVTVAVHDLHRVPGLLNSALQHWLFACAPAGATIH